MLFPQPRTLFPTPVISVRSLLKCHLLRETFPFFVLFKVTTLSHNDLQYLFSAYLLSIFLPKCKTMRTASNVVFSLLYPHSLEQCLEHNGLWQRPASFPLNIHAPLFLSNRLPILLGLVVMPCYKTTSVASLESRSDQRGLNKSHGVELLGKQFEGFLFKENMSFCPLACPPSQCLEHECNGCSCNSHSVSIR